METKDILASVFSWYRAIYGGKLNQKQVDDANKVIETHGLETFATIIGYNQDLIKPRKSVSGLFDISENGFKLIRESEGFKDKAYLDTGGVWTIGYGTIRYPNGNPVKKGDTCTKEQAEEYLKNDVKWVEKCLDTLITTKKLNQNQFDALASFVYNVGEKQFATSTLLNLINKGNFQGASSQFSRWVYDNGKRIQGLVNRRKIEKDLFMA